MFSASGPLPLSIWIAGLLTLASGLSLFIGFLTPIEGVLAGLGAIVMELWGPAPLNVSPEWLWTTFLVIMAASVVLLGPGAFSIDSRLFGRREIIIPAASRSPKH